MESFFACGDSDLSARAPSPKFATTFISIISSTIHNRGNSFIHQPITITQVDDDDDVVGGVLTGSRGFCAEQITLRHGSVVVI